MAIDSIKKVTLLVPRNHIHGLVQQLHELGAFHVVDTATRLNDKDNRLSRNTIAAAEADEKIKKLDVIESTIQLFTKKKSGIVEQFAPVPLQIDETEVGQALHLPIDPLYEECERIYNRHRDLSRHISEAEEEIESLSFFQKLPLRLDKLKHLQRFQVQLGRFNAIRWKALIADPKADEQLSWQVVQKEGKFVLVLIAYLATRREEATSILREYEYTDIPLPRLRGSVDDRIHKLLEDIAMFKEQLESFRERAEDIAKERRKIQVLLGHWSSEKSKILAHNSCLSSKRISVFAGYVRTKDMQKLESRLARECPQVSVISEDPVLGDNPPVSLTISKLLSPGKFLVSMFGMPNYFSFDPSPFLIFCFLTFFGICFGDVAYGLILMVLCHRMARRYSSHAHVNGFFKLFFYGGISTAIVGALTGSWAGNLPDYFGEGNLLQVLKNNLMILDPIRQPIIMLLVALGVGVVAQFYGVFLRMYRELRWGRPLDAIFDGVLWLLYLPGMLLLISPVFIPTVPAILCQVGKVMFIIGAIGLVLTQGRHEKGIFAKAITGLVSLYGIMGSYGGVTFIGDMVSYSRLLALGMTTAVVAMSFNIFADMLGSVPHIGVALFALAALVGHLFNFVISILGAFVHSARLVFLEFFGRFYEGGGEKFRPLGFNSDQVEIVENQ